MHRSWTNALGVVMLVVTALAGCATSKEEMLPHGPVTMRDVWNQQTGGAALSAQLPGQLLDARATLRRPLSDTSAQALEEFEASKQYTRSAATEIYRQFKRLPNPDLVMYVFPHLSGTEFVPVPGYSTIFPLHEHVQYAMPGERTEEY
jgi:conjugative transfer region lipoprotein (TIGR03751 family)